MTLSTDALAGDKVTADYTGATFDNKNVGTDKPVSVTGITISGDDAGNYKDVNTEATTSADINAIKLTVSATGIDKDYDGDNIATVTLSTDALAGDKVTANYTGATFDNKNVGTDKPVSVTGITISGDDAGNYKDVNTEATTSADINAIKLTVSATGIDKDYDGDNIATVTLSTDALAGDKVTADYTGATFDNKNVGTDKPVSVTGITISGDDAGNYKDVNTEATTSADINAIKLTVSATGIDKDYDGDNIATVTLSTDALAGDKVTADYYRSNFRQQECRN